MAVTFDLPENVEGELRRQLGDLGQAAKEALAVESYRQGKISLGQLADMLGMAVIAADRWLAARHVAIGYSRGDLEEDRKTLAPLVDERPS